MRLTFSVQAACWRQPGIGPLLLHLGILNYISLTNTLLTVKNNPRVAFSDGATNSTPGVANLFGTKSHFIPSHAKGLFGSKPGLKSPRYSTRAVYYSHGTCGLLWVGRHHVGDLCLKLVSKDFGHILQQTLNLIQKDGGLMTTLLWAGSSVLTMFLLSIPFFVRISGHSEVSALKTSPICLRGLWRH